MESQGKGRGVNYANDGAAYTVLLHMNTGQVKCLPL